MSVFHAHPFIVLASGIVTLVVLQHEKARLVASLATFVVIIIAFAQILGVDLSL